MDEELKKLNVDDTEYVTEVPEGSRVPYAGMPDPSEVRAFIPGTIVQLKVREGDMVQPGEVLLLLDAMKMHNEICSKIRGRISEIAVSEGDTVRKDQLLVSISES
jgi:glutaconyl-CoA/methylmalonyl-CoA decarboxylase subunit gamma